MYFTMKSNSCAYAAFVICLFTSILCYAQDVEIYNPDDDSRRIDPHSFYYDRSTKMMNTDILKSHEAMTYGSMQEMLFYKRLVTILLSNLSIKKYGDSTIGTLRIEASNAQLEILEDFKQGKCSIREADAVLSYIIQPPEMSYESMIISCIYPIYTFINENKEFSLCVSIIFVTYMMARRYSRGFLLPLFFVIVVISFFMTWTRLIQEAEIRFMAAQSKYSEIPISCQPHKMSFWERLIPTHVHDCEKYYEAFHSNPRLQVTPLQALVHLFTTVIAQPLEYSGHVIGKFIQNATGDFAFAIRWPVTLVLFLSVAIMIVLLPIYIFGGSLNLTPLFGLSFRGCRGDVPELLKNKRNQERIELIQENTSGTSPKAIDNQDFEGYNNAAVCKHQLTHTCCDQKHASDKNMPSVITEDATTITSISEVEDNVLCKKCGTRVKDNLTKRKGKEIGSGDN